MSRAPIVSVEETATILAVLIALFALWISWLSYRIANQTRLAQSRPVLFVFLGNVNDKGEADVNIRNVGLGPALNVVPSRRAFTQDSIKTAAMNPSLQPGGTIKMGEVDPNDFHGSTYGVEYEDLHENVFRTIYRDGYNYPEQVDKREIPA